MTEAPIPSGRRIWNYTPRLPIQVAPYWDWPARPIASAIDLLRSWNPVQLRCLFLLGAVITWVFFTPEIGRAETLAFDWIAEVWVRNTIILFSVAGGLHLLLWSFRVQGDDFRYDKRPMMKKARTFWFRIQVWDTCSGHASPSSSGRSGSVPSGTPTRTVGRQ